MSFIEKISETLDEEFNTSTTENGAAGYKTTGNKLLDLNFAISSLRNCSEHDVANRFAKAYYENKCLAIKWLFFVSDVRYGMGERRLFRICINWLSKQEPEVVRTVLTLIPEYSRWDNILNILDTEICCDVIELIKNQLKQDMANMSINKPISLLAKWLPSANASSRITKNYAKKIITKLGISEREYRQMLSKLRAYLNVVEIKMSGRQWQSIDYSTVPSRANLMYSNAFMRNDETRRIEFLENLSKGETKINAGTLFPHDVVHKYLQPHSYFGVSIGKYDASVEEMWKALPDYVNGNGSTICVADGSGSMQCRIGNTTVSCLEVATALSIYFAERCVGEFENKYITFSETPQLVDLSSGSSLIDKLAIAIKYKEVANTNIEAVFELILTTAVKNNMAQSELPKNILILSDMEFDSCATINQYSNKEKLFNAFAEKYAEHGYSLPRLVFWNIYSRTEIIPIKKNELGVGLVSGFSPSIMKMVLSNKTDPFECLLEQLNSERYDIVENAIAHLFK